MRRDGSPHGRADARMHGGCTADGELGGLPTIDYTGYTGKPATPCEQF
jgi:hypothetical protein